MSKVIPKEQLTAYQRWELNSFEDGSSERASARASNPPAEADEPFTLPTAEAIERLHQQAWQEGYNLGLEEGRKAGLEAGSAEVAARITKLESLAEDMNLARMRQDERIAAEVLQLALGLARQILRSALQVKPELILAALREALLSLPSLTGHHKIVVHPDSAEIVKEWIAHEHGHLSWKVLEDAQMAPGGFRFESAHSELDASLPARWREVVACLGNDTEWIDA